MSINLRVSFLFCYNPSLIIKTSKGAHLALVGFQRMKPTIENIKEIENFIKAVEFIKWQKENKGIYEL